jgi:hypothetical protein
MQTEREAEPTPGGAGRCAQRATFQDTPSEPLNVFREIYTGVRCRRGICRRSTIIHCTHCQCHWHAVPSRRIH